MWINTVVEDYAPVPVIGNELLAIGSHANDLNIDLRLVDNVRILQMLCHRNGQLGNQWLEGCKCAACEYYATNMGIE